MIVFDLKCSAGHVFEAWFGSSMGYDAQRAAGLVECPVCGDRDVGKAVMAPNIAAKSNQRVSNTLPMRTGGESDPSPELIRKAMAALAEVQTKALKTSKWVGPAFADRARAMHEGEEAVAPIHGQATRDEAQALIDDGIPVAPLIVPVVPPEALN